MRKDAESHASEDKKQRELVDARNQADSVVYEAEKQLRELADKVGAGDKEAIDKAIEKVKSKAASDDVTAIKAAVGELQQAMMAMGQAMYGRSSGAPGDAGSASTGSGAGREDDAIDVEFKEKT
jgi:molecular chaperone DnaK